MTQTVEEIIARGIIREMDSAGPMSPILTAGTIVEALTAAGYAIVPVEPTPRMLDRAFSCLNRLTDDERWLLTMKPGRDAQNIKNRSRWAAMIEAANSGDPDFTGHNAPLQASPGYQADEKGK